jgi:HAMP domain-containing protein
MPIVKSLKPRQLWSHSTLLALLLVCSVGVNLLLARKTKRLQSTVDTLESGKRLLPGSLVPPFKQRL